MPDIKLKPWRVLLVDDDGDDYHLTRSMLAKAQSRKIELDWAPAFKAGQELMHANHYHAVLIDYDLGPRTGIELIREMTSQEYPAPLILYTGRGSLEVDMEAMEAGATLYLTKEEASPLLLERLIRYAIERKRVEGALEADLAAMQVLHEVSTRFTENGDVSSLLQAVLHAAIEIAGADKGNVQMLDPEKRTLSIVAQHGFERSFLDFFAEVDENHPSACGEALHQCSRMVVEEVENSPVFTGTPALEILREAGVQAVQSTPLLTRTGRLVGILSTHWSRPYNPEARILRLIDLLARQAADFIERKQAQEALRKSEARMSRATEIETVGIIFFKTDGSVTNANDAFLHMSGYSREDLEKGLVRWDVMTPPEWMPDSMQAIEELISTGQNTPYEKEYIRKDGSRWWALFAATLLDGDEGVEYIIDITDRKRAEDAVQAYTEELKRSNQALEDFAFMASHDLREPLRKVEAFSDLLVSRLGSSLEEQERDYIERMRQATARMQNMLDGLLDYSRVTVQGRPFEETDMTRVAAEALSDLEMRLKETGGSVELGKLPVIQADPTQMHQLLQNLIGNAIKFHKPGVPPYVKVSRGPSRNDHVALIVEDNGIGFDMSSAGQLFKPFHRLVGKSAYEGSGMGLAICKKIAERHRGSIMARSEPGVGSTFTVTLPHNPNL